MLRLTETEHRTLERLTAQAAVASALVRRVNYLSGEVLDMAGAAKGILTGRELVEAGVAADVDHGRRMVDSSTPRTLTVALAGAANRAANDARLILEGH